jgi:hypothetical protein
MTQAEAQTIIADYLVGRRVPPKRLEEASAVIRADPALRKRFERDLGTGDDWVSECDMTLSRLAEFSGRPEPDRQMPSVAEHLRECASCREVLWGIKPLWTERVGGVARSLATSLRVRLAAAGQLLDIGWGPPSSLTIFAAATAALPGSEPPAPRSWELTDEEAGYVIRIGLSPGAGSMVRLTCAALPLRPDAPSESLRLEVLFDSGGLGPQRSLARGPLEQFETSPIPLPAGSWVLRLRRSRGGPPWEIPIQVEPSA